MSASFLSGLLYGDPPPDLVARPAGAVQTSPLRPGASLLDEMAPGSAASMAMVVPPGTIERRHALAQALRVLAPGAPLIALGPKDKGGARVRAELERFGCVAAETSKKHWRLCQTVVPPRLEAIDEAIALGAPRFDAVLGLWTQPGIFSWDRIDEGSALLLEHLGALAGTGADFGCGLGLLSRAALARNADIALVHGIDLDARAIRATGRNVDEGARLQLHWHDVAQPLGFSGLDFVLMNPPFHSGGQDDVALGRLFLRRGREALRVGGTLWMVANRHLPYEAELAALFARVEAVAQGARFKVLRATA